MTIERWEIDSSHSGIHFSVRHLVIAKVRGKFARWSGALSVPDGDLGRATVDVTIDATSIDTGVADRDTHLKSADFFDVERFPEITFKGARVEAQADGEFRLIGELTIHGVTREVALEVEATGRTMDPWGNERLGFEAKTSVDRKQFGLAWNQVLETGGVMVGDKVEIELEIEAVKQVAVQAA